MEGVHELCVLLHRLFKGCLQLAVKVCFLGGNGYCSVEILLRHGNRAVYKIAEIVCKVCIEAVEDSVIGYGAVVCVGHLGKCVVSNAVNTDFVGKYVGIYHISAGF